MFLLTKMHSNTQILLKIDIKNLGSAQNPVPPEIWVQLENPAKESGTPPIGHILAGGGEGRGLIDQNTVMPKLCCNKQVTRSPR